MLKLISALFLFLALSSSISADEVIMHKEAFVKLKQSVMKVSVGTAFLVEAASGDLYILTNWHVCREYPTNHLLALYQDKVYFKSTIVKRSAEADLCIGSFNRKVLKKLDKKGIKVRPLKLSPTAPKKHDWVATRGYPGTTAPRPAVSYGEIRDELRWTGEYDLRGKDCDTGMTKGLNAFGQEECTIAQINTAATLFVAPGSSGSPVVDINGNLVGVINSYHYGDYKDYSVTAGLVTYQNLKKFLKDL